MRTEQEITNTHTLLEHMRSSDRFAQGMLTALAWVLELKDDLKKWV